MNSNGCDHFNMLPIWRIPIIYFLTRILKGSQMTINPLLVCCKYTEKCTIVIVIVHTWTSWNDNLEATIYHRYDDPFVPEESRYIYPGKGYMQDSNPILLEFGSFQSFFFCWWLKSRTSWYGSLSHYLQGLLDTSQVVSRISMDFFHQQ